MTLPLEQIENGTLSMFLGIDADGVMHFRPNLSEHSVSDNEWDEILLVSETIGLYTELQSTRSHRFFLYNSPTKGLNLIFMKNDSGNDVYGWYEVTLFDLMRKCLVNGREVATHPWWPNPSEVNNMPNEYARTTRMQHHA